MPPLFVMAGALGPVDACAIKEGRGAAGSWPDVEEARAGAPSVIDLELGEEPVSAATLSRAEGRDGPVAPLDARAALRKRNRVCSLSSGGGHPKKAVAAAAPNASIRVSGCITHIIPTYKHIIWIILLYKFR
jgi:hypothetical protein